jgi:uncharacterized protein YjiS (DUF1127 family)
MPRHASTARFGRSAPGGFFRFDFLAILSWMEALAARRRGRRALLEMTDTQLKDIGLSRADAYREGERPIWEGRRG